MGNQTPSLRAKRSTFVIPEIFNRESTSLDPRLKHKRLCRSAAPLHSGMTLRVRLLRRANRAAPSDRAPDRRLTERRRPACKAGLLAMTALFSVFFPEILFASEPAISRVSLSQKAVDLTKNEKAVIEFQLAEKSFVDLLIYDEVHSLIRNMKAGKKTGKGKHTLSWDGRSDSGEPAPSGVYIYVLEARGGKPFRFDPRSTSGGEEVLIEKLSWDVPQGVIHYLLPKASYARIRIGLKEGLFLGTLQDWTPLDAGEKEFPWNGRDQSGHFDLSNHTEAQINISAFALPDNAVIVRGREKESLPHSLSMGEIKRGEEDPLLSSPIQTAWGREGGGRYLHSRHPRPRCHEPNFKFEFPESGLDSETKSPILKGKAAVRITLDPQDKDYLTANRFEIMFFADTQFLFEQEEGTSPFTVSLDTARLGAGEHLITINVMDYEDHIGVETVKVKVNPAITPDGVPNGTSEAPQSGPRMEKQSDKEHQSTKEHV